MQFWPCGTIHGTKSTGNPKKTASECDKLNNFDYNFIVDFVTYIVTY